MRTPCSHPFISRTTPRSKVKEWRVILATLVIFCTGVVTGGMLVHLTSSRPIKAKQPALPAIPGSMMKDFRGPAQEQRIEYLRRLTSALELTPEQAGRVDAILHDSQQRSKSIWEATQPKLGEEVRKTREHIRELLNPEQRKRFDELNKQRPRKENRTNAPAGISKRLADTNATPARTAPPQP